MIFLNLRAAAEDKRMLDDVLQLPNISREVVREQAFKGAIGYPYDGFVVANVVYANEVGAEQRDIATPVAKRWKVNGHDVKSIVKVFPKFACFD